MYTAYVGLTVKVAFCSYAFSLYFILISKLGVEFWSRAPPDMRSCASFRIVKRRGWPIALLLLLLSASYILGFWSLSVSSVEDHGRTRCVYFFYWYLFFLRTYACVTFMINLLEWSFVFCARCSIFNVFNVCKCDFGNYKISIYFLSIQLILRKEMD